MGTTFIEMLTLGMWAANCVVVGDRERGRAFVVDPGQGGHGPVQEVLDRHDVTCEAILLTHGHLDHLWAVPDLVADLGVPVRMHSDDRWLWDSPAAAFGAPDAALKVQFGLDWNPPTEALETFRGNQTMTVAGFEVRVRHTPGHTPGSCIFISDGLAADPVCISGDLIFAGSVGRTDFPRGSFADLARSIHREVLTLDDTTRIISGHGPETTVGRERASNPFVAQILEQLS